MASIKAQAVRTEAVSELEKRINKEKERISLKGKAKGLEVSVANAVKDIKVQQTAEKESKETTVQAKLQAAALVQAQKEKAKAERQDMRAMQEAKVAKEKADSEQGKAQQAATQAQAAKAKL